MSNRESWILGRLAARGLSPLRWMRSAPPSPSRAEPPGFPQLTQRIRDWTCNLVATTLVLAAAVTLGRQVVEWWDLPQDPRGDARWTAIETHSGPSLSGAQQPIQTEFGGLSLSFRRSVFAGDQNAAMAALRAESTAICRQCRHSSRLPGPVEQEMLQRVAQLSPAEAEEGQWSVYQLCEPLPLVVAVQHRGETPRVLSWGMALPSAPSEWTLVTTVPTAQPTQRESASCDLPIPHGGRRGMSLRADDGSALVCLTGEARLEEWLSFFSRDFAARGWVSERDWCCLGDVWMRRFHHRQQHQLVQIVVENRSPLSAIMTVAPY